MSPTRRPGPLGIAVMAAALVLLAPPGPDAGPPAGPDARQEATAAVDINTASVEELTSVRGLGQVIAQRIVEFREKNGPFKTVDDLLKVQGIGEKSLAKLRDRLMVGKPRK